MTSAGHSFQHLGIVGFIRAAARAHKLDIYLKQIVYAPNTRPWVAANPPLRNHTSTNGTPGANYHPQKFSLLFLMSSPTFYVRGEWWLIKDCLMQHQTVFKTFVFAPGELDVIWFLFYMLMSTSLSSFFRRSDGECSSGWKGGLATRLISSFPFRSFLSETLTIPHAKQHHLQKET